MNAVRGGYNYVSTTLAPYAQSIQMFIFVTLSILIVYIIYSVLFPAPDDLEQVIVDQTVAANSLGPDGSSGLITVLNQNIRIETGGEYTFHTWMYISNWDYRAGQPKHVFSIGTNGTVPTSSSRPDHLAMVGVLYPSDNKLAIRVYQDPNSIPAGATASPIPDLTVNSTISSVFGGGAITPSRVFGSTVGYPICDINNIDLQKWIALTIVVNGRVVDVYVDGKLARSCVTPGIPTVETGDAYVTIGSYGGWGGNISTTRVFGFALTPGNIYEMYQTGPANTTLLDPKYGFLGWLWQRLSFDVRYYTGYENNNRNGSSPASSTK